MKTRGFEKVARYMDVEFPMPERKPQQESGEPEQAAKGWMFQFAASTIRIPRT